MELIFENVNLPKVFKVKLMCGYFIALINVYSIFHLLSFPISVIVYIMYSERCGVCSQALAREREIYLRLCLAYFLLLNIFNTSMMEDKEIKNLRKENADLLRKIEVLQKGFSSLETKMAATDEISRADIDKSLQFFSGEYEDIKQRVSSTINELKRMSTELSVISERLTKSKLVLNQCNNIVIYDYNLKICVIPQSAHTETSTQSSEICLRLFHLIGAKNLTMYDIDIAHRVPK